MQRPVSAQAQEPGSRKWLAAFLDECHSKLPRFTASALAQLLPGIAAMSTLQPSRGHGWAGMPTGRIRVSAHSASSALLLSRAWFVAYCGGLGVGGLGLRASLF